MSQMIAVLSESDILCIIALIFGESESVKFGLILVFEML